MSSAANETTPTTRRQAAMRQAWPATAREIVAICARSVLVIDGVVPDICGALAQEILELERLARCSPTLSRGGWKSGDLFAAQTPGVRSLRAALGAVIRTDDIMVWAMVNRAGASHPRHVHRSAVVSGVYFVDPGGDPPTPTAFEVGDEEVLVWPEAGRLALFSGDLWHRVPECLGDRPRITVAFDVRR